MTEEQKDQQNLDEEMVVEEPVPADNVDDVEKAVAVQQPDKEPRSGWTIAIIAVAAVLALCCLLACLAAAAIFVTSDQDTAPGQPPVQVPTKVPSGAMITITYPDQGDTVDVSKPIMVKGKGSGLPEGNVVIEVMDWEGNVLDQRPATLEGEDAATGGTGTWSTELSVKVEPGTAGEILAYSVSPEDGEIVAEDSVEVSLGRTEAVQAYIRIDEPVQGAQLDISRPVTVGGMGAGLPEGNVVVEALDSKGDVLDRQPVTLQGPDVGTGGEGTWTAELTLEVEAGTAGKIWAYSPSPKDGSIIAEDSVEVSLGATPAVESFIKIEEPAQGKTLDVSEPIRVSGSGGGLPEGNVVVVALDENQDVLTEESTTLEGPDVGTGGEGTRSVDLAVPASGQVPGYIAAFSTSPKQRSFVASDHIEVIFSGGYTLEGPTWLLDKTIPGSEVSAVFDSGRVSGSAGCNTYSGSYVSTGGSGQNSIRFEGPFAMTRMMCDEPLMDQEQVFMAALESATEYTIEGFALAIEYPGGTLLFYDKDGPRPRR